MVESGGLENRCGRKFTGGSNPSLSVKLRPEDTGTTLNDIHQVCVARQSIPFSLVNEMNRSAKLMNQDCFFLHRQM